MATFNSSTFFPTALTDLYGIVNDTRVHFLEKGYEVTVETSPFGGFISLSKGAIFKSILGMKTALNVDIRSMPDGIQVDAKVGIWAQQALPTLITLFVTWPVLLTQITGLLQQARLDDEVLQTIGQAIEKNQNQGLPISECAFCISCGASIESESQFCPICGEKQS